LKPTIVKRREDKDKNRQREIRGQFLLLVLKEKKQTNKRKKHGYRPKVAKACY
jgi:hypothetical protein